MPDTNDAQTAESVIEPAAKPEKAKETPRKTATKRRARSAKAEPPPAATAAAEAPAGKGRATRKVHSDSERAQKLGVIESLLARGRSTLKDAVKKAGISEQTYYQWKKAAEKASQPDDLRELVKLEEENLRLKKLLADRLRSENAELRKRLGLGK